MGKSCNCGNIFKKREVPKPYEVNNYASFNSINNSITKRGGLSNLSLIILLLIGYLIINHLYC